MIFDKDMMKKQMNNIGFDTRKMPLGKLSKDTIKKGYTVLTQISEVIDKKAKGDLYDLTSKFFTYIPHAVGFQYLSFLLLFIFKRKMSQFVINTKAKVKEKMSLLESLGYIEIAERLTETKKGKEVNEIDENYSKLNCKIEAVAAAVLLFILMS